MKVGNNMCKYDVFRKTIVDVFLYSVYYVHIFKI